MHPSPFKGDLLSLRKLMRETDQMQNLSVLDHGLQVARYFEDLRLHVLYQKPLQYEWRLPEWALSPVLWQALPPLKTLRNYHIYHDCGKPLCKTIDDNGRPHFPDHANVSADTWLALTGCEDEATLMRRDMEVHLLKGNQVESFCEQPFAATLLLTGLSELHANAAMFGGTDSTSFKIKFKQLNRRGKAIADLLATHNHRNQ